jgi:alpha-1,2-glucosyltransferase
VSCTFRQTNVVWVLYAYAVTQIMHLRFRRAPPGAKEPAKLHDPPALEAGPCECFTPFVGSPLSVRILDDLVKAVQTLPSVLADILPAFVPYALVFAAFGAFVVWNGGIVLGALITGTVRPSR